MILAKGESGDYCEPWSRNSTRRNFDRRLVKAEPSLEEMRACGHSTDGTNSSGRATPSDASPYTRKHLILDQSAKAQLNFPRLVHPGWAKSRSLDIHNGGNGCANPAFAKDASFRRSMSDDNLIAAAPSHAAATSASNPQLNGSDIYDEPWDRASSAGSGRDFVDNATTAPRNRREVKNPSDHREYELVFAIGSVVY